MRCGCAKRVRHQWLKMYDTDTRTFRKRSQGGHRTDSTVMQSLLLPRLHFSFRSALRSSLALVCVRVLLTTNFWHYSVLSRETFATLAITLSALLYALSSPALPLDGVPVDRSPSQMDMKLRAIT